MEQSKPGWYTKYIQDLEDRIIKLENNIASLRKSRDRLNFEIFKLKNKMESLKKK